MAVADDLEHLVSGRHLLLRKHLIDRAADHHAHDLLLRRVLQQSLAHHLAIAEDRVAVGDAVDLVELVGDEQDRLPLRLQEVDQIEQVLNFLVGQGCRRLVHDDDLGIDRKRARHRHQMLVGDGQVLQLGVGRDMAGADFRKKRPGARIHSPPVDQAERGAGRMAEEDVFRNRQLVEENSFLVNRVDAGLEGGMRRRQHDGSAGNPDLAFVRLIDAGHGLDQRRLAGTVLADQCGHLARIEAQPHLVERTHAGKGFGDSRQLYLRLFWDSHRLQDPTCLRE